MWIHYIAEIGLGLFALLIGIHFLQHFMYKAERIKKQKKKQLEAKNQSHPKNKKPL